MRTIDTEDWTGAPAGHDDVFYDPVNHALWAGTNTVNILFLDVASGGTTTHRAIVEGISERLAKPGTRDALAAGTDFDATALTDTLTGYSV
ncbi:MAG: hypothetical protein GWN84_13155, partial [Gammaproteobacteria bacterium]|nr:hypothetical protein [Gammaproteobacteria bacterium]NIR30230.1 hypothetical protein [Gammaproteobacteria bacterium]NIR83777.1 hypothetical protein [Gammaproteobacteria bacterium]NIU05100.1 hypothetical protein [Gammaproteobacteria bacterium]NIV50641.1 hypothetical protein [Gammaproteobacteria bacterium]